MPFSLPFTPMCLYSSLYGACLGLVPAASSIKPQKELPGHNLCCNVIKLTFMQKSLFS